MFKTLNKPIPFPETYEHSNKDQIIKSKQKTAQRKKLKRQSYLPY